MTSNCYNRIKIQLIDEKKIETLIEKRGNCLRMAIIKYTTLFFIKFKTNDSEIFPIVFMTDLNS